MCLNPLTLKNFMSNPPYCLPYNLCNVSLENLKLDQPIIPLLIFFLNSCYLSALYHTNNVRRNSVLVTSGTKSFNSQDLTSNFPYYLLNSSCDVSLEDLVLDHLIIPQLIFFFILITCLLDIVLIL